MNSSEHLSTNVMNRKSEKQMTKAMGSGKRALEVVLKVSQEQAKIT